MPPTAAPAPFLATLPLRDGRVVGIRKIHVDDAAANMAYIDVTAGESEFLAFGRGESGMDVESQTAFLRSLDDEQKGFYLIAVLDGVIVGLVTLARPSRPRVHHVGELGLSVLRSLWGQGLGTLLTTTVLAEGRRTGVTRAWLQVRPDNARALRLYERLGFRIEGRREGVMKVGDVEHDLLVMARPLL